MGSASKPHILHLTGLCLCISFTIVSTLGLIAGRYVNYYYETTSTRFHAEERDPGSERGSLNEEKKAALLWKEDSDRGNRCDSSCCGSLHVDIKTVDQTMLNSEERMSDIMGEVLNQSDQSEMISHKCDTFEVGGISCIGILSDSQVSLRSRSSVNGSITLSLFAHGSRRKVSDILHGIEILLKSSDHESIGMRVKDFPCQNTANMTSSSPKPESKRDLGDENVLEAFVHPAMFTHTNPKRVAIIGGDKNVLREVLKHNSITKIEIFPTIAKNRVEEEIDCSDFIGREENCNANEIVDIKSTPFSDYFSVPSEEVFDVVLVNIDPSEVKNKQLIQQWFTDDVLVKSLYRSLSDNGLVVFQLGELPKNRNPPTSEYWKLEVISSLELAGFQSVRVYSEGRSSFSVVMKNSISRMFWDQNAAAEVAIRIHERIVWTHSESSALKHFDSSTMRKYQFPHKAHQTAHCRTMPKPIYCGSLDSIKNKQDIPLSDLDVKMSTLGDGSGRGLFARVDLKKGSTMGLKETRQPVFLGASSVYLIGTYWDFSEIQNVWNYVEGYGWEVSKAEGVSSYYVEPNVLTFSNHGCNGSYDIIDGLSLAVDTSRKDELTEQNAKITDFPKDEPIFMPYIDRHLPQIEVGWLETLKDKKAGEEIFSNYLFYTSSSAEEFYAETQVLKRICNGEEVGLITLTEAKESSNRSEL